ncbi:S41 family peptidase [bacterium]|jgi:carboxyl-terminal processing protease|nr:S41 family peptidase [bacterium]
MNLISIGLFLVVACLVTTPTWAKKPDTSRQSFNQVRHLLQTRYMNPRVNSKFLNTAAISGMIDSLGDPHTQHLSRKRYRQLKQRYVQKAIGVGIHYTIQDGYPIVTHVDPNSPADTSGVNPFDKLVQINTTHTEGLSEREINSLLMGRKNTQVTLEIRRFSAAKPHFATLMRRHYSIEVVPETLLFYDSIGYIRLTSFDSKSTVKSVRDAVIKVRQQGAQAIILDLRNNTGGLLKNAVAISSLFLKKGIIVKIQERGKKKRIYQANGHSIYTQAPLVILVNKTSASASEIVAGSLKEHKRAIIVGETTFGKGTIQRLRALKDGSALLFTAGYYQLPSGTSIQGTGIKPDRIIELSEEDRLLLLLSESSSHPEKDLQLHAAIDMALLELDKH